MLQADFLIIIGYHLFKIQMLSEKLQKVDFI